MPVSQSELDSLPSHRLLVVDMTALIVHTATHRRSGRFSDLFNRRPYFVPEFIELHQTLSGFRVMWFVDGKLRAAAGSSYPHVARFECA